ncbi:MAG: starch synthase [Thermoanaerobaculia bacterium]|nr:starch synthase [Thermoanaerobaculia bacterium]
MNILFATAEVSPIAKTGGLGDVCGALPKALVKLGHDVTIFMPFYREASEWFANHAVDLIEAAPSTHIRWGTWAAEATYVRTTLPGTDIPLILVANDYFFNRPHIYSPRFDGYDDGVERYTFFCRAVIRGCELLGIAPDIVHAHDWHTALLPVYLHSGLRGSENFRGAHSVYTIHNLNYQGIGAREHFGVLGLHSRYWAPDAVEHFGYINLMKGGIIFANQVTTVSPTYANEIQSSTNGAGLDGILRSLSFKLNGILNGIDTEEWDPAHDPLIESHFHHGHLAGKSISKRAFLRELKLPHKAKTPLLGFISRLTDQKGIDLLIAALPQMLAAGAQAVVLGSGEPRFENALRHIAARHPESCRVVIGFDNALAHRIYSAADILLMPSIYEPCGLNQMYALRYGTIPVVRLTGGLADTVIPFHGANLAEANGFGFFAANPADFYTATWLAMLNYRESKVWRRLQDNGMAADFSWERSAREYEAIYHRAQFS